MYYPANCNFMSTALEYPFMLPIIAKSLFWEICQQLPSYCWMVQSMERQGTHEKQIPPAIKEQFDAKGWILSSTKCDKV